MKIAMNGALYIVPIVVVKNHSYVRCAMVKGMKDVLCVVALDMIGYVYLVTALDMMVNGNVGDVMEVDMTIVSFVMEVVKMIVIGAMVQEEKTVVAVMEKV